MSDIAINVDGLWKKFRIGEYHDSLRDLIPAVAARLLGRRKPSKEDLNDREFWAIRDVSFQVARGESRGIIGPNGAGKSTMLKLLTRIMEPTRGTYRTAGRVSALIEVGAGFHRDLTGRENIYLNGAILGMKKKDIASKEDQIIEFAGVRDFIDTPVKRYSSGMRARLGFAVAAHMDPDILLVDEVLSVGDTRFRAKCIRHMKELIASDVTVIFISHILEQVRSLCPNTIVLHHGEVAYDGATDGAIQKYLDLLSENPDDGDTVGLSRDVEVRDVVLRDAHGNEVLEWTSRQPAIIDFELLLHKRVNSPSVMINFSTLGGQYIGTANTRRQGLDLPSEPGAYRVQFALDPMPLGDGEYALELKVAEEGVGTVWFTQQPRVVSVRGGDIAGAILLCDGQWSCHAQAGLVSEAS